VIYRGYVSFGTDSEGKTTIKERRISAATDKKAPEKKADGSPNPYAGLSTTWAKAEEDGLTLFNENEVITYSVKSIDGFEALCPDPAIRLYIIQTGLASVQTARANALMKAMKENTSEPEPEFTDYTLDLAKGVDEDGLYSINKTPTRRGLSEIEKLVKYLTALGVPPEKQEAMLQVLASQSAPATEEEVEA
jgi:hypothetical protein